MCRSPKKNLKSGFLQRWSECEVRFVRAYAACLQGLDHCSKCVALLLTDSSSGRTSSYTAGDPSRKSRCLECVLTFSHRADQSGCRDPHLSPRNFPNPRISVAQVAIPAEIVQNSRCSRYRLVRHLEEECRAPESLTAHLPPCRSRRWHRQVRQSKCETLHRNTRCTSTISLSYHSCWGL